MFSFFLSYVVIISVVISAHASSMRCRNSSRYRGSVKYTKLFMKLLEMKSCGAKSGDLMSARFLLCYLSIDGENIPIHNGKSCWNQVSPKSLPAVSFITRTIWFVQSLSLLEY